MNRRQLLVGGGVTAATLTFSPRLLRAQEATPLAGGAQQFALPGDAVYPEGFTYDATTNLFYTGSTTDGTVFQGDLATGEVTVLSENDPDRTSATGMTPDGAGHLVVAGGGTGVVSVIDLASGEVVATFTGAFDPSFLNDAKAAPNGDTYITDSMNPVLYRIAAENIEAGGDLEQFIDFTGTVFEYGEAGSFNANGLAVTADGAAIIIINNPTGQLFKVDIATGEVTELTIEGEPPVNGDGIALDGQLLYVVRNQDGVIARFELDAGLTIATELDAFTDPSLAFPTTMALVDSTQALVVNSQFNRRETEDPVLPFTISLIDIPPLAVPAATPQATPQV